MTSRSGRARPVVFLQDGKFFLEISGLVLSDSSNHTVRSEEVRTPPTTKT